MDAPQETFRIAPVYGPQGELIDLTWEAGDKRRGLCGRSGAAAEEELALTALARPDELPVFLGFGLGAGPARVLAGSSAPVAVVDIPEAALATARERDRLERAHPGRLSFISTADLDLALSALTRWQIICGGARMLPLVHPGLARVAPGLYRELAGRLQKAARADLTAKARYPKFAKVPPRVLLFERENYFIQPEMTRALTRLGCEVRPLVISPRTLARDFVAQLTREVLEFRPDVAVTLNHHGLDASGMVAGLTQALSLPLASWLVDNPELLLGRLPHLATDTLVVFSCDTTSMAGLRRLGHTVHHLPLATDPERFAPGLSRPEDAGWRARVSFVGDNFRADIAARMRSGRFEADLLRAIPGLAEGITTYPRATVEEMLTGRFHRLVPAYQALLPPSRQLDFDAAVAFTANSRHREEVIRRVLPLEPLVVGPASWKKALGRDASWRWIAHVYYDTDLPRFYPLSEVNLNVTGVHMRGAVNQRLFDVPACGAFVLTDLSPQMQDLFDPGTELAVYRSPDEILERARFYLDHPEERARITQAARKRILAEHTYDKRMGRMLEVMRQSFGP